ncbi:MAG TPA: hypothetical protein VFG99_11290, partial [Chloroflexia bacterium]|nr:hypothetical protein [Chloroflexia bacterium]
RYPPGYGQAVACPGTVRESAPGCTVTDLEPSAAPNAADPSALEPAPPPSMGCPQHSRSPWPELRLRPPGPFRAPGALVRSCRGALSYSERPRQDPPGL